MIVSANIFPPGQFYHVAATYDGQTMKLFVDGMLEASRSITLTVQYNQSNTWTIGASASAFRPTFDRTWVGLIDELEIFNRALSQPEIQAIFDAGSAGKCKIEPVTSVTIDIKPGSDPNCFTSDGNGVIPVAILGSVDLDVNDIDIESLLLDGQAVAVRGKDKIMCHIEEINGDFIVDLVCQIEDEDGTYQVGEGTGTITGSLEDGTPIEGSDSICITQ